MRRLLICLLAISSLSLSAISYGKTLKIATISPNGSLWMTTMSEAADEISKKTDNRINFRFYPGGVMGNDNAVMKKIRIGQLQGAVFSGGALASQAPNTQIYNIPLLFNSYEEVDYVRQHMDADLEKEFDQAGFISFGLIEGGFAYIMSKKPIADAEELRKNKVWAPSDDPAAQSAAEIFKFSPTTLAIGDVLTGLQTDMINTITTSPIAAIALQWHTQVNYITDLPIAYFFGLMAIDKKAFKNISAEDQKVINQVMRNAFKKMDHQNRKDNQDAFAALKKQGIKLVTPTNEQISVWKEKTADAAKIFASRSGIDQPFQNKINQLLADFRKSSTHANHQ